MRVLISSVLVVLGLAAPARAELVFFATGKTMSVRAHRSEGDSLVLMLRSGGEILLDGSLISRIEPDEVPYPEPEPATGGRVSAERGPGPILPVTDTGLPVTDTGVVAYSDIIETVAAQHGVSAKLVKAVIQAESAYQERARSPKGAMGLMQLMPETARQFAVADPYEPRSNIEGGTRYLKSLLDRFELPLALAAYNAGEAAVRRYRGIPPYRETQDYVSRVLKYFRS